MTAIINMMRSVSRTTRWLVTASLVVSLGFTGLFPPALALGGSSARSVVAENSTKCCCGTADGSCCGMGCCLARRQTPPKEPVPAPQNKDCQDGQGNTTLAILAGKLLLQDLNDQSKFGGWDSEHAAILQDRSLVGQHVRLDA